MGLKSLPRAPRGQLFPERGLIFVVIGKDACGLNYLYVALISPKCLIGILWIAKHAQQEIQAAPKSAWPRAQGGGAPSGSVDSHAVALRSCTRVLCLWVSMAGRVTHLFALAPGVRLEQSSTGSHPQEGS